MTPATTRTGADRCPGTLQPFRAEDGLIVRVRVPGGEMSVATLQTLARIAEQHGDPRLHLTSRANLQLRGLPDPLPDDVSVRIAEAGLLPSPSHERARNILAAPMSPRQRQRARDLDALLQQRPNLAGLPGRFLMLLTEGDGLGLSEPFDIAFLEQDDGHGLLLANGRGRRLPVADAFDAMLDLAERFLAERADDRVWNIKDLPAGSMLLSGLDPVSVSAAPPLVPGTRDADLIVGLPLGLITGEQLSAIADVTDRVVLTPWRAVLIEDGAPRAADLERTGLITRRASTWSRLSACPGAPYCSRAATDTMDLAAEYAATMPADGPRVHLVGCDRACGRPRTEHRLVVAARSLSDACAATCE